MFAVFKLLRRIDVRRAVSSTVLLTILGCTHLRQQMKPEMVYVVAKQTYLRDRVAAVSNRIALVTNGDPLQVVERGRRFLKVKTSKGEVGWIEEHMVINQAIFDQFAALQKEHAHDPVVATGVLRDDLYLHVTPGRETDRFYLLPENDKLQLLIRSSVAKPVPPQALLAAPHPAGVTKRSGKGGGKATLPGEPTVPMEDWWLVRDSKGQVGWMLSRRLDVDVPDEIGGYSEGQKIVGAYVLTKVYDADSSLPDKMVPEYVSVTNAYKDGLPYDFNQVRVFTWNTKKHRYETAYRQRNIEGYLPVTISQGKNSQGQTVPQFSIKVASGDDTKTDPATGVSAPGATDELVYQLESGMVHHVTPGAAKPAATTQAATQATGPAHTRRRKAKGR
jgi:SH3-like domain-containing protein